MQPIRLPYVEYEKWYMEAYVLMNPIERNPYKRKSLIDGVKISKGGIVGRVDGYVIYDPSAWLHGWWVSKGMYIR